MRAQLSLVLALVAGLAGAGPVVSPNQPHGQALGHPRYVVVCTPGGQHARYCKRVLVWGGGGSA